MRWLAIVVEAVAHVLLGPGRIEGDVEEIGAIAVRAEHVGHHEAGASVVALVTQDTVQFQGMSNGLVDLQDHLIWCQ